MTKEEIVGTLVGGSKQIESVLDEKFGAQGKGLHSKALSIQSYLGAALLKKIQYVATIRNKAVHEDGFQDIPINDWTRAKDQVLAALDALDPPEAGSVTAGSMAPVDSGRRGVRPSRAGGAIGFLFVAMVGITIVVVNSGMLRGSATSSSAAATPSAGAAGDEQALATEPWSTEHPAHATQAFPWREEQAAFIAAGEKGTLPNETMWQVTSSAHQVKRKGEQYLELDIQLGGGKTTAKVFFSTKGSFGAPEVNSNNFDIELPTKKLAAASLQGTALKSDGHMFGLGGHPFECKRDVPGGCGDWTDNGVSYFALSSVSYGNTLKIADVR